MKSYAEEQNAIRQYLLGLLGPEQRPALEERLLTDDAFYEELLIAEDDLIDQYVADSISPAERESFETHFLVTPERQKKLRFARVLKRCVAARDEAVAEDAAESPEDDGEVSRPTPRWRKYLSSFHPRNRALAFSLAAAALIFILIGSWVWLSGPRLRKGPHRVFAVTLSPGLTRDGGELKRVRISPDSEEVQLRLALHGVEHQSYNAALLSAEGSTLLKAEGLNPVHSDGGRAVVFTAPPKALPPGDYVLKLDGINGDGTPESVGSYPFRILP